MRIFHFLFSTLLSFFSFALLTFSAGASPAPMYEYGSSSHLYQSKITQGVHALVLNDPGARISHEFKVPAPMKNTVLFWLKIYTEYSTQDLVIFDRKHPEVVYEVLNFSSLAQTSRNQIVYEILRERQIKKRIHEYRQAFQSLAKRQKKGTRLTLQSPGLTPLQKIILTALSNSSHAPHSFTQWERGLRTQTGQRDNVIRGLHAAKPFIGKMEEIFFQLGLPIELTRIPLVESSFNIQAHSRAGAVGIWQFMPKSGQEFLTINDRLGIDERRSPLKSTVAAARLLKRNLKITTNWPLAITAYNHGFTGIRRLTRKEKNQAPLGHLFSLCQTKKHLGYASANYYAEFLAMLYADAYQDVYFGPSPKQVANHLYFHRIKRPTSVIQYALKNNISLHQLQVFNPDVKNLKKDLPKGFYLVVPGHQGEVDDLISSIRAKAKQPKKVATR